MATILFTGGTNGLGKATLLKLAQAPVRIILLARSATRGAAIKQAIEAQGQAQVTVISADLQRLASVEQAIAEIAALGVSLDVLVNNAAVNLAREQITEEGFEAMLATNFLAPFMLTEAVSQNLPHAASLRIINVGGRVKSRLAVAALGRPQPFDQVRAFAASKAALGLYTALLRQQLPQAAVWAYYPGIMRSPLSAAFTGKIGLMARLMRPSLPAPARAAAMLARLILTPDAEHRYPGLLYDRRGQALSLPHADDLALLANLYARARQLVAPYR